MHVPVPSGWTEDIGDLEGYVARTSVMLFFLSKTYFASRNCLREVRASLEQEKPLVLVHEQQEDKGGGPLEQLRLECRNGEMRAKIFDGRAPIVWHRVSHYKNLTVKLIATQMLKHGPKYSSALSGVDDADDDAPGELSLVLPGEVNVPELALTRWPQCQPP